MLRQPARRRSNATSRPTTDSVATVERGNRRKAISSGPQLALDPDRNAETRRQILVAAATLFYEKGYKATTLRDIAKVTGMALGSSYYHFTSKEDILREVLESGQTTVFTRVLRCVEALPPTASELDKLSAALRAHLDATLESDLARTYWRIYNQLPPNIRRQQNPKRAEYFGYWHELVAAAKTAGLVSSDLQVTTYVDFLIGGLGRATEWYDPHVTQIGQLATWIETWVFNGIAVRREAR
jgi:AcrR family transcriptional regulator